MVAQHQQLMRYLATILYLAFAGFMFVRHAEMHALDRGVLLVIVGALYVASMYR